MLAFILLAAVASATPAVPARGDLRAIFTADDYPDAAVCMGQEGDVQAKLTVAPNGRVSACAILRSSGFPALDAATCDAFRQRARFTPARDSSGNPIADEVVTPPVSWQLEGNELPLESWTLRLLVGIDKKGQPQLCSIQAGGALGRRVQPMTLDCSHLSGAFIVPPELAKSFAGKPAVIIFDQQFVPRSVSSIETPRDLRKYALLNRDVLRFNINSQGRVGGCTRAASEGSFRPPTDGCEAIGSRRFEPDAKLQTTSLPATATTAIYAYTR